MQDAASEANTGFPRGPLEPMPPASGEAIRYWLHTLRLAVLLSLGSTLIGAASMAAWAWLSLRPWWEPWGHGAQWIAGSAGMLLNIASAWLIAAAQPGRASWRRARRWGIRVGYPIAVLVSWGLSLRGALASDDRAETASHWTMLHLAVGLFAIGFGLLLVRHLRELCMLLRDAWLRKRFTFLYWIGVVLAGLTVLLLVAGLFAPGFFRPPAEAPEPAEGSPTSTAVGGMLLFGAYLWLARVMWRLARRLREAVEAARRAQPAPAHDGA